MTLDVALRLTEILLAIALFQQSLEYCTHEALRNERWLFLFRALVTIPLFCGFYTQWVCLILVVLGVYGLHRFQGPYNGGSDRMGLLVLFCLCLALWMPAEQEGEKWREYILGYLALQLILSYVVSGWVKIVNPDWRSGKALREVFLFSAYPVSESLRGWAQWPGLLWAMSWVVIVFELLFPLALISQASLLIVLVMAALFHLGNAFLFGLNRFFWIWLAAYPSIIWFQGRIFGSAWF